jgi:hypothetical protein
LEYNLYFTNQKFRVHCPQYNKLTELTSAGRKLSSEEIKENTAAHFPGFSAAKPLPLYIPKKNIHTYRENKTLAPVFLLFYQIPNANYQLFPKKICPPLKILLLAPIQFFPLKLEFNLPTFSQVSFQVANALDQPFPDGHFDLVWAMESGEHMPDKEKVG